MPEDTNGTGAGFANIIREALGRGDRVTIQWIGWEKGLPVSTVSFDPEADILTITNGAGTQFSIAVSAITAVAVNRPMKVAAQD
jgi:hypothetical protein